MNFLIASFQKDLERWRQERSSFLIWLAIPFLIGGLMTMMFGSGGGGPSGLILIDDQDDTLLSGFVASAFTQEQMGDLFTVRPVDADEGTALIEAGEASGFLTIPAGFQDAFLNDTAVTLTLKTNPSQTILPGIIEDVTEILLDAGFYLQAMFSNEISQIQDTDGVVDGPSNAFVSGVAVQINEKIQTLGPSLFPPAFDLEIVAPPPTEPQPDIGVLILPGIVLMALLFSSQGLSSDYWKERQSGTLRRLVSSPGLLRRFVFGKAMAATVVLAFVTGITMSVGFLYNGIAWSKFLPSMLWVITAGVGFFAWFAAIQMMFSSQKGANLLTMVFLFPLLMMGGSFFPLDALPDGLARIGRMSPNGFVADRFTIELTSSTAWTYDLNSWAIVIAVALSGLLVCSWRLQSGFARQQ